LRSKFSVWLGDLLGTGEKQEVRSGNQKEEHIDYAAKVEYCAAEKHSRRRYIVATGFYPSWYVERKEDEATCNGVTDGFNHL
jgi:hypothetical protein